MTSAPESSFVFNIVWTGTVFPYLRYFVASQMAHSDARFRFIANACPPDQIEMMEKFAVRYPDRVVEVVDVSSDAMVAHGVCLDRVRDTRDDGDWFCLIDPDILANGPFLDLFVAELDRCAGITSGRGVWRDDDLVPPGHPGVSGEYFYSQEGYLFGSPHFAIYHRAPIDEVTERWGIGLGSAGPELSPEAKEVLARAGHAYLMYDTGKLMNIFLQETGHPLLHREHPNLIHIGGMSHFLSPPGEALSVDSKRWPWPEMRAHTARFTAAMLSHLCHDQPAPEIPDGLPDDVTQKLALVRRELVELVATYDSWVRDD